MSRRAATARRVSHGTHTTLPRHTRRISGPVRSTVALPAPPPAVPHVQGVPNPFRSLKALPDHPVLERLLRSNAWIWIIGLALGGIVAMQVSLLKLNAGISRAVEASATLERQNAELEIQVARLSSEERIRAAAGKAGLVAPDAGGVTFLNARGAHDIDAALRTMRAPGEGVLMPDGSVADVAAAAAVTQAPAQEPTTATAATTSVTTQQAPVQETQQPVPDPTAAPPSATPTPPAAAESGGATAP